jgi:hypothetical protein
VAPRDNARMRIGKPVLYVVTPLGVAIGLEEAWRLTGGLVVLFIALVGLFGVGIASIVSTVRRENREAAAAPAPPPAAGANTDAGPRPE